MELWITSRIETKTIVFRDIDRSNIASAEKHFENIGKMNHREQVESVN